MAHEAFDGPELKNEMQGRFIRDIGRRTAVLAAAAREL